MSALDRLLEVARRAEPDALDDLEVRRVGERAAMTGRARHLRWTRTRVMAAAGIAGALAAAAMTIVWHAKAPDAGHESVVDADGTATEATELELRTGDRLVAAAGARFHVELPDEGTREIRLEGGSMLFDVRPIDGGRFSVATPIADVVVVGTVFAVCATDEGTTVHVYEGRVEVRGHGDGRVRVVTAGGVAHLGQGVARDDVLESEAREAVEARRARDEDCAGPSGGESAEQNAGPAPTAAGQVAEAALAIHEPATVRAEHPSRGAAAGSGGPPRDTDARSDEHAASGTARMPDAEPPTDTDVRAWIADGDAALALDEARRETRSGHLDPWRMLEGDALRALGRIGEAAAVYRRAAQELASPKREQAGFLEARLRARELDEPEPALRALHDAHVTSADSPLRERGLALEAELLARLGRATDLDAVARAYLRDYPDGPQAEAMRAYLSPRR